ncbi:MAG TPA: hypothetical protein VKF83_09335 [Stellaceae bacterium]|nr:hypothetical protein [Stellaceae bacterium]
MAVLARILSTAALVAGLAIAPAAHAEHWHGGGYYHHGGNAAGAAIIGGLVGLGLGAAIASNGGYYGAPGYYAPGYYAPPYSYYGPPSAYYTPAPPPVYYGY